METDQPHHASDESSSSGGATSPAWAENHRRGVLPIKFVRITAFAVISVSIFACAVLCLLAVWNFAQRDTAWRALASLGIITAAMTSFVCVNEVFGRALGSNKPLQK